MKKFFLSLFFVFLCSACLSSNAHASEWIKFIERDDGSYLSVDTESLTSAQIDYLENSTTITQFWLKASSKDGSSALALLQLNLKTAQYRYLEQVRYNPAGNLARSITTPSNWAHIPPDSNIETLYKIFIGRPSNEKKKNPFDYN